MKNLFIRFTLFTVGASILLYAVTGLFAANAFFWEKTTYEEKASKYLTQIENISSELKILRLDLLSFEKDHAIDKLQKAATEADTTEITRLNGRLVEITTEMSGIESGGIKLHINFIPAQ